MSWETVIGLEVHVQLRTRTKMFCGCRTSFGDPPNTNVCPVCLGLPGALPVPNAEAVRLGATAALALGCTIHHTSVFARKNYFYPDLPKGYQISQFDQPLATGGRVTFESPDRGRVQAGITRLHLEEDAGKLVHDRFPGKTAVDLNRAGVPLAEIVSEPDLRSPAEARAYLTTLRQILIYAGASECSMEQGSLRVDANISIRRPGESRLGTKTEVKNLNSFANVERALEAERSRQVGLLEGGGRVSPGDAPLQRGHRPGERAQVQGGEPRLPLLPGPRPAAARPRRGLDLGSARRAARAPRGPPQPPGDGTRHSGLRRAGAHQRGAAGGLLRVRGRGRGRAQDRGQLGHERRHDHLQRDRRIPGARGASGGAGRSRARRAR